jgi:2-polyprenyl-3-methyl-5-hydroxy-6-metoxy-1,4-benzoquinol methylase
LDVRSWTPYGLALLDFFNGKISASVIIHEADGTKRKMSIDTFFREFPDLPLLESTALGLCRGRVLDIGAGAGCHTLALQDRGFSVCAIDISPDAVEVMRKRGVKEVYCSDIFDFQAEPAEPFDTILMMMNGIGLVENSADLDRFLAIVRRLLKCDGQILLDSSDMRGIAMRSTANNSTNSIPESDLNSKSDSKSDSNAKSKQQSDRYIGEVKFQMEYNKQIGPPFWWLFIDPDMLIEHTSKTGWSCQVIYREWDGHYLARLRPIPSGGPETAKVRSGLPAPLHPPE